MSKVRIPRKPRSAKAEAVPVVVGLLSCTDA